MQSLAIIESAEITKEFQDNIIGSARTISKVLEEIPDIAENYIEAVKARDGVDLSFSPNLDLFFIQKGSVDYNISKILSGKFENNPNNIVEIFETLTIILLFYMNISKEKNISWIDIQKYISLEKITAKIQLILKNAEIETVEIYQDNIVTQNFYCLRKQSSWFSAVSSKTLHFILELLDQESGELIDAELFEKHFNVPREESERRILSTDIFTDEPLATRLTEYVIYLSDCYRYFLNFCDKNEYDLIKDLERFTNVSKKAVEMISIQHIIEREIVKIGRLNKSTKVKRDQKNRKKTEIIKHLESFQGEELLTLNKVSETLAPKIGNSAKAVTNYLKEMTGGQIPSKHKFSREALLKLIQATTAGQ